MEEHDYIQLQTLLAKLEIAIGKKYRHENMTVKWNQQLQALTSGIKTIRKNIFFEI